MLTSSSEESRFIPKAMPMSPEMVAEKTPISSCRDSRIITFLWLSRLMRMMLSDWSIESRRVWTSLIMFSACLEGLVNRTGFNVEILGRLDTHETKPWDAKRKRGTHQCSWQRFSPAEQILPSRVWVLLVSIYIRTCIRYASRILLMSSISSSSLYSLQWRKHNFYKIQIAEALAPTSLDCMLQF